MATIFISHSSQDKAEAEHLMQWLESQGFESLFLDSDARHGIKAGSEWEKTLYREIRRADAFLFLLSENWLDSQWCGFEFMQARALGKIIFPLRIQSGLVTQVAGDIQQLDLTEDRNGQLQRLHAELTELTLNIQQRFAWDKTRPPYPGMLAFEAEDAPVFFGRDAEINRLRERLNQLRTQGSDSLLVMLAASGAGKSSLLKAGLLPRLRRDDRHWIVLEALRPEQEPLRKLAQVLATACDAPADAETLYAQLQGEQALDALRDCINRLRALGRKIPSVSPFAKGSALQTGHTLAGRSPPLKKGEQGGFETSAVPQWEATVLLSIDQAEELFSTANPAETTQLLQLLTQAQAERLPLLTLMAMRGDYLEALQAAANKPTFSLYTLDPLPLERVSDLIRGPAAVVGLEVEDGLITAATQDAATADALPLLAFALRELYERFGADGDLTLDEYRRLGSDTLSPLENAVQHKASEAIQPEQLKAEELQALRDAFIPHMVRVNDAGDYVRQPAHWGDLPAQAQPLLDKLTNARLLVQRSDNGAKRVEVAHEALLRHWRLLNGWLREEHDFLLGKQQLEHSLRDWQQLPEPQRTKGLLQGIALERAREWLLTNRVGLSEAERDYIRQSHQADEDKRKAEELRRKKERQRLIGFVVVLAVAAALAVWQAFSARASEERAQRQQQRAETARNQAEGVINFMVFDLRDKLEPIGRLDIMRDVQERVSVYYANSGEEKQNQEYLWQRAVNASQQADTLANQGKLSEAEKLYREAYQFMQQRADNDPSNAGWQRDLAISLIKIGDILSAQGKLDDAKAVFEKSMTIRQKLADNDPSNAGWQYDLGISHERIGMVEQAQGNLDEAIKHYRIRNELVQKFADNDPSNAGWQHDLAISLRKIGDVLTAQGKLDDAKAVFEKDLAIAQKLADNDPSNAGWQRDLSVSLEKIGEILTAQGKLDDAKAVFEKSMTIRQKLADNDPSNAGWQYDLGISHERIGNVLKDQGQLDEALKHYKIRNELIQKLADNDPSNAGWQRDLSVSLNKIGEILTAQGKLDDAKAVFEKSMTIREKLADNDPSNAGWQTDVVVSHVKLLGIAQQKGEAKAAREHGEKALAILKALDEKGLLHGQQR